MKFFLSPSNQFENNYAYGNTNEGKVAGEIAHYLEQALLRCGCEVKLVHDEDAYRKTQQADKWGADRYIPIHTNACNGNVAGTRLFCYNKSGAGYRCCVNVMKHLGPASPGESDNITADPTLIEVKYPKAPTCYIEIGFHDNLTEAKWLVENKQEIAETICMGLCEDAGIAYVKPPFTSDEGVKLYRIQVGAFTSRTNAEGYLADVRKHYPNAFMIEVR